MLPFFGTTAIVIAALTASAAPVSTEAVQAQPAAAPVIAVSPPRQSRRQAVSVLHRVLSPNVGGDGG